MVQVVQYRHIFHKLHRLSLVAWELRLFAANLSMPVGSFGYNHCNKYVVEVSCLLIRSTPVFPVFRSRSCGLKYGTRHSGRFHFPISTTNGSCNSRTARIGRRGAPLPGLNRYSPRVGIHSSHQTRSLTRSQWNSVVIDTSEGERIRETRKADAEVFSPKGCGTLIV